MEESQRILEREISEEKKTKKGSKKTKKRWYMFKKLKGKTWKLKLFGSVFTLKPLNLKLSFFDNLIFKIASVIEAIVLGLTLCFYFFCCGCNI